MERPGIGWRMEEWRNDGYQKSQDVVFCTALLGHEVMCFTACFGLSPQRNNLFAESGQQIAQPLVEEVLREAVPDLQSCQLTIVELHSQVYVERYGASLLLVRPN